MPTNTTNTAAYVAVETNVSTLDTLMPNDKINAKIITAAAAVTKLFVSDGPNVITTMGTMRKTPPAIAIANRASLSTNSET